MGFGHFGSMKAQSALQGQMGSLRRHEGLWGALVTCYRGRAWLQQLFNTTADSRGRNLVAKDSMAVGGTWLHLHRVRARKAPRALEGSKEPYRALMGLTALDPTRTKHAPSHPKSRFIGFVKI